MKKVRITAIIKACYKDLIQQYENPLDNACTIEDGQVFIAEGWQRPDGMCGKNQPQEPWLVGVISCWIWMKTMLKTV